MLILSIASVFRPCDETILRVACWLEYFDLDIGLNKGYGFLAYLCRMAMALCLNRFMLQ